MSERSTRSKGVVGDRVEAIAGNTFNHREKCPHEWGIFSTPTWERSASILSRAVLTLGHAGTVNALFCDTARV
jgi:prepilin-type processing-associated H-X9-DG protein